MMDYFEKVKKDAQDRVFDKKFGKLQALNEIIVETKSYNGKNKNIYKVKCKCSCGRFTYVEKRLLLSNQVKSCGHCNNEKSNNQKYSDSDTMKTSKYHGLYLSWIGMKNRCLCKNHTSYKNYGAKGISICEEWLDYENFKSWSLNNGWEDGLTIDRIDCSKNYCPSNCRWATYLEQGNNRGNNVKITYKGKTQTLSMWCKELNFCENTIKYRLNSPKFTSIEEVFETPLQRYNKTHIQNHSLD